MSTIIEAVSVSAEPHSKKRRTQPPNSSSPSLSDSSQRFHLLSQLPSPLFALIASNLPFVSLLHLQRCSKAQRRLRIDESYLQVAWRWTGLLLSTNKRLPEWTLPSEHCVVSSQRKFIPVSVWQAALPVLEAEKDRMARDATDRRHQRLRELVGQPQPTTWLLVKRKDDGSWTAVDEESAEQSADVQRVEVLRDVNYDELYRDWVPNVREVDVRCRWVLQACPFLQHFGLEIDTGWCEEPSHEDTFALLPSLRSLGLSRDDSRSEAPQELIEQPPIDFQRMLSSLPHLTALDSSDIYLDTEDLIDIASHSTLEELVIKAEGQDLADHDWIGPVIRFPSTVEEDEWQMARHWADMALDGDIEEERDEQSEAAVVEHITTEPSGWRMDCLDEKEEGEPEWVRHEMQRIHAALTRTPPTRKSCRTRMALAEWLHRRLRRGGLHTDERDQPKVLLRSYRKQVALLRWVLRHQLSELTATAAIGTEAAVSLSAEREAERLEQLQLLGHQLAVCVEEYQSIYFAQLFSDLAQSLDKYDDEPSGVAAVHKAIQKQKNVANRRPMAELQLRALWLEEKMLTLQNPADEAGAQHHSNEQHTETRLLSVVYN